MISEDDINAFLHRWGDAMHAADERAFRQERHPKQFDMWASSVNHEMLVGPGIRALQKLVNMQSAALEEMMAEKTELSRASMSLADIKD